LPKLGVSAQTIRNVFKDEPNVLRLGNASSGKRIMSVSAFLSLWQCVFIAGVGYSSLIIAP
jgi:hypothetical protein